MQEFDKSVQRLLATRIAVYLMTFLIVTVAWAAHTRCSGLGPVLGGQLEGCVPSRRGLAWPRVRLVAVCLGSSCPSRLPTEASPTPLLSRARCHGSTPQAWTMTGCWAQH